MINLTSKQRGASTIEFSIVGVVFSLLIVFSNDVLNKISHKGKLDRLSYSLVNILKERTQLYNEDYRIKTLQAKELFEIASKSMSRNSTGFKPASLDYVVESVNFVNNATPIYTKYPASSRCQLTQPLEALQHLSRITTWNRRASLYRVTLCYETQNMFGSLIGGSFTTVQSDALIIGR